MVSRGIFVVGLILLAFSICSSIILIFLARTPGHSSEVKPLIQSVGTCTIGCGSGGGGEPPNIISYATPNQLIVYNEWPKQMDSNTSEVISLAFTVPAFVSLPEFAKVFRNNYSGNYNNRELSTDKSIDTLGIDLYQHCLLKYGDPFSDIFNRCLYGTPISDMFGSGYETFASAHLITTSFDIQLLGSGEQPINQSIILWNWNILPRPASNGIQIINLDIEMTWKPINKSGESILRQLWQSSISINVNKPFIELGQISLGAAVPGAVGLIFTGFSLPWIWEQRQKRQEEKKKTNSEGKNKTKRPRAANKKQARLEKLFQDHIEKKGRKRRKRKTLKQLAILEILDRFIVRLPLRPN